MAVEITPAKRKSHKDRAFTGKVDTGSGGVPLADDKRFFRVALNHEIAAGDSSASEKSFLPIREYALQAEQIARSISDRKQQLSIVALPYFPKRGNAFTP